MSGGSVDLAMVVGSEMPEKRVQWNKKDAILYALGIGCTSSELRYIYEKHQHFQAIPTLLCAALFKGDSNDVIDFNANMSSIPGIKCNPAQILHGEEYLELLRPVPTSGDFVVRGKVLDFLDKGKGGVMVSESMFHNEQGEPVAKLIRSSFFRGLGNNGGRRNLQHDPRSTPPKKPKGREPDAEVRESTGENQAMLYRLSGDFNPLHADPNIAQMVGFPRPILHGLATFGIAARAVLAKFCDLDASRIKSIRCRFSSPVLPGDVLVTKMWRVDNFVLYEVFNERIGSNSISGGAVELRPSSKL